MNIEKTVENIGTTLELKRIAKAYVIDYKNLSDEEIREAMKKTAPQYYFKDNVIKSLKRIFFSDDRDVRILSRLILKMIILNKDNFMCPKRETEDDIIDYEQSIINRSNEDILLKSSEKNKNMELFGFILDTAWQHNDSISVDEKNLLEKIKDRLKITDTEYHLLEAKLGKFPKQGNIPHIRDDIEKVRRCLQEEGLVFSLRDNDNTDFDIIPEEIAKTLREIFKIEIRKHGYRELLKCKYVRSKTHMQKILKKIKVSYEGANTVSDLQEIFISQVSPSILLGGTSPRDGLDITDLKKWCSDINTAVSGSKVELIERIIGFYDSILEKYETVGDEREMWYEFFDKFARRDLEFLRSQQLIQKDLECEKRFEEATEYLFEKKLNHKPLNLVGTSHADGALSFQDKVIFWDNKSKETPVNLKDHIRQFDGYIASSQASGKIVACFIVIGPEFTAESAILAMQYQVEKGTTIMLITASELKEIAEIWDKRNAGKKEDPFNLGYFIQPGRFNKAMVQVLG